MGRVVGAKESEIIIMGSLTSNLHHLMISFYKPSSKKYKIIAEEKSFPSDTYAMKSQIAFHGYDPNDALIRVRPREGETILRTEDIIEIIKKHADEACLVLFAGVHYFTGQAFDIEKITKAAHDASCIAGFDLAHAAGNIPVKLHDWDVDFACWCSYKYLNSSPGGIAGCFIHEKHHANAKITAQNSESSQDFASTIGNNVLCGWWGHENSTRFQMNEKFLPEPDARVWQLSNPPVLLIAVLRSSLRIFDTTSIEKLREKSIELTGFLEELLCKMLPDGWGKIITPSSKNERGCQLSLVFSSCDVGAVHKELEKRKIICDRRDNCIRVAPTPLYNTFEDCFKFASNLSEIINSLSSTQSSSSG